MKTANENERRMARENDVKLWQIADYLGVSQSTFTVWLRRELSPEKKKAVVEAIEAIAAQR